MALVPGFLGLGNCGSEMSPELHRRSRKDQVQIAPDAFSRYGEGRHPARLSLGDCFSYALAKAIAEPLLCKGTGFKRTDITTYTASCR